MRKKHVDWLLQLVVNQALFQPGSPFTCFKLLRWLRVQRTAPTFQDAKSTHAVFGVCRQDAMTDEQCSKPGREHTLRFW